MAARVLPSVAALVAALAAGCVLYTGGDDPPPWDAWVVYPDARLPIDAEEECPDCPLACDRWLPCPVPAPNRVSVCGRLVDVGTLGPVQDSEPGVCDLDRPSEDGVCSLRISFHDALDVAGNPTGAMPLAVGELYVDRCGRFAARDVVRPGLGFLAVVVDDAAGVADRHALAAVAFPVQPGGAFSRATPYAATHATDEAWSAQAGLDGASFVARGAILVRFFDGQDPAAGVQLVTDASPPRVWYFAEDWPLRIQPSRTSTSSNGVALGTYGGTWAGVGAERPGCRWSDIRGGAVPGALFVARSWLVNDQGLTCP